MEIKQCTKCKTEKLLNEFGNHPAGKNGLQSRCKECMKNYTKNYIAKDRETHHKRVKKSNNKYYNQITSGVYMMKNLITGDCYIGESKRPLERWERHLYKNAINTKHLIEQYGKNAFIFGILEFCNNHVEREKYYIEKYQPKYNTYNGN